MRVIILRLGRSNRCSTLSSLTSLPSLVWPQRWAPRNAWLLTTKNRPRIRPPIYWRSWPRRYVSSDQLLGIKEVKSNGRTRDNRLWRRFSQVDQLPQSQRKQIVQILDAFLERDKLRNAS